MVVVKLLKSGLVWVALLWATYGFPGVLGLVGLVFDCVSFRLCLSLYDGRFRLWFSVDFDCVAVGLLWVWCYGCLLLVFVLLLRLRLR